MIERIEESFPFSAVKMLRFARYTCREELEEWCKASIYNWMGFPSYTPRESISARAKIQGLYLP